MKTYIVCVSADLCPVVLRCFAQNFKTPVKMSVSSIDEPSEESYYVSCRLKDSDGKILKELKLLEKSFRRIAPRGTFVLCDPE